MVCICFKDGSRRVGQCSFTGAFKALCRVFVGELQKSHAGFVALLLYLVAYENSSDNRFGIVPDLGCPLNETLTVPLDVLLMVWRHVIFHGAVLICSAMESGVRADTVPVKENLHSSLCHAHIHLLLDVFVGSGVIHMFNRNMIVWPNDGNFPCCQLKRSWRQR